MAEGGWSAAASSSEAAATVPSDSELVDLSHDICSIWKNIGFRLGLPTATLDNIAGTPGLDTPQKKALEMLTKWHQGQTTSSRGALCAVLRKEGRTDLADKYSIHQQESGEPHPTSKRGTTEHLEGSGKRKCRRVVDATSTNLPESQQTDIQQAHLSRAVAEIVENIRERYKDTEAYLTPFPWYPMERNLDDIHTELKLVRRNKDGYQVTDKVVKMPEIFQSHEELRDRRQPRSVLLEGDPGMGKTVFCQKLTYDWAVGKSVGSMADVDVLLKLKCRDLENSDIKEAISSEFLPEDTSEEIRKAFFDRIQETGSEVLFVLDGWDELREGIDLSPLLERKVFPSCRLLVTSRKNETLRKRHDTLLQMIGFTRKKGKEFIEKYFGDDKEKGSALLYKIGLHNFEAGDDEEENDDGEHSDEEESENGGLLSLIRSPLNTILLCAVFQETGSQLPVHTTHLYQEIVACIVRIRYKKKGEQPPADPVAKYKEELAALGRLALQGIKDDQLHFSEDNFQAGDPATRILQFGFLSKQTSASVLKPRSSYQFLHKTVQEFLAAMCLQEQLTSGNFTCLDYLGQYKVTDLTSTFKCKQVVVFVAGLLSQDEAGRQLLPRFVSSLTRSLSSVDSYSSFLFIRDVLRECVGCPQQAELERLVVREFGWEGLGLGGLRLDENSAEYRIACGVLRKENCPLKELYLYDNNIHDGSLLTESLRDNTSLQRLSLFGNPLTADSASALARVLSAHRTLQWLFWLMEFRGEMEEQHRNPLMRIYYY